MTRPIATPVGPADWRSVFFPLWLGQTASLLGSALVSFSLAVWLYERTGSSTLVSLVAICATLPGIVAAPIAGVLVDRFERGAILMVSDVLGAFVAASMGLLFWRDALAVPLLCLAVAASSLLVGLRHPAYHSWVSETVPAEHLGRVSGLLQLSTAGSELIGPLAGGFGFVAIGLGGMIAADTFSFVLAFLCCVLAAHGLKDKTGGRLAHAEPNGSSGPGSAEDRRFTLHGFKDDLVASLGYLHRHTGTFSLLVCYTAWNFALGIVTVLATPLLLTFAGPSGAGAALATGGAGMVVAAVIMSGWKGPRHPVRWVLAVNPIIGLAIMAAGMRPSLEVFLASTFVAYFGIHVTATASQTFWMRWVAPEMRGRVFALRRMFTLSTIPLAYAVAGTLADHVFEPALLADGTLAHSVGVLLGTGPGRGIGLIYVLSGAAFVATTIVAVALKSVRRLDLLVLDKATPDFSERDHER